MIFCSSVHGLIRAKILSWQMRKDQVHFGRELQPTSRQARRFQGANRESQCTASKGGRRLTTSSASSVARTKLQPERRQADKMTLIFSKKRMRSSTTTTRRSLPLSMRGWSCEMTRNGLIFQAQNSLQVQKRGSWTTVHNHQHLTRLKARCPRVMKA